jgi:hypothetical protein
MRGAWVSGIWMLAAHASGSGVAMPGPARAGVAAPGSARENAECEGCHPREAAEWRTSLHRNAYTSPAFARALRAEPLSFCRGCHAPEAPVDRAPDGEEAAVGVACVTCHGAGDRVLAAPSAAPSRAPHGVVRDAAFASDAACAGCHEFAFPDRRPRGEPLMQRTVAEHAHSPAATTPCAGCHMPRIDESGGRSHLFAASRDAALVRSAVVVTARRRSSSAVAIAVTATPAVGHAMPTGDLFRRIEVVASMDKGGAAITRRTYLARHFRAGSAPHVGPSAALEWETGDDRPGARGARDRVVVIDFGNAGRDRPIRYRVTYERAENPGPTEETTPVEGRIVLAEGEVDE